MRHDKANSLDRRFFIATSAIGAIVLSTLLCARAITAIIQAGKSLDGELRVISVSYLSAVSDAAENGDRAVLRSLVEAMVSAPIVSYAAVINAGNVLVEAGSHNAKNSHERISALTHDDKNVDPKGRALLLQGDIRALTREVWTRIFDILPFLALGIALTAATLNQYFKRAVAWRLAADARRLDYFDPIKSSAPFASTNSDSKGDIEALETHFNELSEKLRAASIEATEAQKAADVNKRRYQALFDSSPVALFLEDFSVVRNRLEALCPGAENVKAFFAARPWEIASCRGMVRLLAANEASLNLLGARNIEQLKPTWERVFDDDAIMVSFLSALSLGETRKHLEGTITTLAGERRSVVIDWQVFAEEHGPTYEQVVVALMDVTEHERTKEKLRSNIREKEVLIRELFHRTKNNMQSILSLISFESWKIEDETFRSVLRALEARVYSMSLVHRMLYEYNDLSRLSLAAYLREFAAYLSASEGIEERGIRFDLRLEEIEVTIDIAVPVGLIVTELVDNALEHAFPANRGGTIAIDLSRTEGDRIALIVEDDGIGTRRDFNPEADGALGLQLIASLAESQLGGEASFTTAPDEGFRCRVTAQPDLYKIRV